MKNTNGTRWCFFVSVTARDERDEREGAISIVVRVIPSVPIVPYVSFVSLFATTPLNKKCRRW